MEESQLAVQIRLAMMCNIIHNGMLEGYLNHLLSQSYINRSDVDLMTALIRKFTATKPLVDELIRRGLHETEALQNAPKN